MDEDLRYLIREKNNIHLTLKQDRNNLHMRDRYKDLKKLIKSSLHKTKAEYYNKELENNRGNMAAIWKIIKELVPDFRRKAPTVLGEGKE